MDTRPARSPEEDALLRTATRRLPGGVLGGYYAPTDLQFVVKEARGARFRDVSGREYIDYLLGSGPMVLGHAHPAVIEAVERQIGRGTTYFQLSEPAIALAEEICRAVPCADQLRFTSTGSEATFFALRLARAFRGRDKILKFEGGFHGTHDYSLMSVGPKAPKAFPAPTPDSAGIPHAIEEHVLVAPFNDLAETEAIFDEVVTGFRFAYGGAQEFYGVVPDLAAFGKIIGGGFPLAAVVGREEIMRRLAPEQARTGGQVQQAGTLNGNPIARPAGLATLAELRKPGTYERLFRTGNRIKSALQETARAAGFAAQVAGEAPVFEIYFSDQPISDYRATLTADMALHAAFTRALLERGIVKAAQKIYVSLAHGEEEIEQTVQVFTAA